MAKADIERDTFFQEQMRYALKSWLYAMAHSNAVNGLSVTTQLVMVRPWWQTAHLIADGVFGGLTLLFTLLALLPWKRRAEEGRRHFGWLLALLAALAGGGSLYLYRNAYNTSGLAWICLITALAVLLICTVAARWLPKFYNWGAPLSAALAAGGLALSATVMADPVGYALAGLYPVSALTGYLAFLIAAFAAWFLYLLCGFVGLGREP